MAPPRTVRGFTLVELLVALVVLALLAVLSWRGLDGMVRVQQQTQARSDEVLSLQVGLAQWAADLDGMVQIPQMTALDWNGRVLRLTRRAPGTQVEGLVVVAWSRRGQEGGGRWMRWQSPPATSRGQVEEAWLKADAWSQNAAAEDAANEVDVIGLLEWQVFFYRGDAWTNPLSSDASQASQASGIAAAMAQANPVAGATRAATLPDGVRIILTLPAGQAITGDLTRDWVRPTVGGGKS